MTNEPLRIGGWVLELPREVSSNAILSCLRSQDITLSARKIKRLDEHHWIWPRRIVIPWGFFHPSSYSVVYEDPQILAIHKPPFLPVVASLAHPSLLRLLKSRYPNISAVHRLDFETSGMVVFAKTAQSYRELCDLFATRKVQKTYWAWVHGVPAHSTWEEHIPLTKVHLRAHSAPQGRGQVAYTRFRVLQTMESPVSSRHAVTLLEAIPVTGRYHQIRAHLAHRGITIVGEPIYGGGSPLRQQGVRMQLHAHTIQFHLGGKPYALHAKIPSDMLGCGHDLSLSTS